MIVAVNDNKPLRIRICDPGVRRRLLANFCLGQYTLGRITEAELRYQLGRLGFSSEAINGEVEYRRRR